MWPENTAYMNAHTQSITSLKTAALAKSQQNQPESVYQSEEIPDDVTRVNSMAPTEVITPKTESSFPLNLSPTNPN